MADEERDVGEEAHESGTSRRADRVVLRDLHSPPMRAFHVTWVSFFLCFFAWFAVAPLSVVVKEDLGLSQVQLGNTVIASVLGTILARVIVGACCDHFGPRKTYSWLMILSSLPVMGIGLAQSYESFLLFRLAIGAVGASFVITQVHASLMFAPRCVGTATATTAAWGNLGGGVAQWVMPLALGVLVSVGLDQALGWRFVMLGPGLALLVMGFLYPRWTLDTPDGHFEPRVGKERSFGVVARDKRVWCLFGLYAACFGVELTLNNVAALYFHDRYGLGLVGAGLAAGVFGFTNLFARPLGGFISDRIGRSAGLKGRVHLLGALIFAEGVLLIAFSEAQGLVMAVGLLFVVGISVQMAEGATFGVVVFVRRRAMGAVVGLVAAGGNAGAVAMGFLFRVEELEWARALSFLGIAVALSAALTLFLRFSEEEEEELRQALIEEE
jgi:NNP family nitrate/nitrite transporter-like MFS transporter